MPRVDSVVNIKVECPVFDSFRVQQIAGMFDVPLAEKSTEKFSVELPGDDESWQVGLIVGPSAAKIQLAEMLLDTSTDPPTKQLLFDIILSESLPLEPDDRFTAEDGATYRLQSLEQANRIDALPIAHVVREEMV